MQHPVVITVVFHPQDKDAKNAADAIVAHFDKIGMKRSGVSMRAPVRFRSQALSQDGDLAPITALASRLNVVIVLYGAEMADAIEPWAKLGQDAERRVAPLLAFVVPMAENRGAFPAFQSFQTLPWREWNGVDEAGRTRRLLLHIVNATRRQLAGLKPGEREKIFISHAKADGKRAAERIVRHMSDPANGLRLDAFYDASDLETGEDWAGGLQQAARDGSMLALATDAYDGRPWCNQEILWAKQSRRALLIVDIGRRRVERSFPYAGNVTWIRDPLRTAAGIEAALLEVLSEGLRCDLFAIQAEAATGGAALIYPRPPELADLVLLAAPPQQPIVYPDPALPQIEVDLLAKLANGRRIVPLSDFA